MLAMDYGPFGRGGIDDGCIATPQNRFSRGGHSSVHGRTHSMDSNSSRGIGYGSDMKARIRQLELQAYSSVLRAFKAQDDTITWEKEGLITELRKELNLSNEEHKDILSGVNADNTIQRIRDWRQSGRLQPPICTTNVAVHDSFTSFSISASRKKQKTASSMPFQSYGDPAPPCQLQAISTTNQPSPSIARSGYNTGATDKKQKLMLPGMYSLPYGSGPLGRGQFGNHMHSSGAGNEPTESASLNPLVGRKVRTRWPADNNFYEAVIAEYNQAEGRHALVYDMGTESETWEWVNLSEIAPEDISWEGEVPRMSHRGGYRGRGNTMNRPVAKDNAPGIGRGRGVPRGQQPRKDFPPPAVTGIGKNRVKGSDDIRVLDTAYVLKEVETVFSTSNAPAAVIERAKKLLEDHEQSLVFAISRINELYDGDRGEGFLHGQAKETV